VPWAGAGPAAGYPLPLVAVYLCLLGVAVGFDVYARRIPNAIVATIALVGLGAQAAFHGWIASLSGLGAGLTVVLLLWLPWTHGGLGGAMSSWPARPRCGSGLSASRSTY